MRCIRSVKSLRAHEGSNLRVVALYTDVDREAPFVRHADNAIRLPVKTSEVAAYLDHDGLLDALKQVKADAQTGLFIECLYLTLPGLAYVLWLESTGAGHFRDGAGVAALLMAAGPATVAPLALFAWSARRLTMTALGFLQFLAPTIQFAIGVSLGEPFTPLRALSFALIWTGVAVFAFGVWRGTRPAAVRASTRA